MDHEMISELVRSNEARDTEIRLEREHSNHLADVLRFVWSRVPEPHQHVIAIPGTEITTGDIVAGTFARDTLWRTAQDARDESL